MTRLPDIIGKTVEEAEEILKPYGIKTVRVTKQNGQYGLATADYRLNRVNVWVDQGKIVHVTGVG